jgi:hypothetical protein
MNSRDEGDNDEGDAYGKADGGSGRERRFGEVAVWEGDW